MPSLTNKGFTLIELMVAIAIVAILSTVGLVIFSNTQVRARNSARTLDVSAIADALQSNKAPGAVTFTTITGANFSGGSIPRDPKTGAATGAQDYCFFYNNDLPPIAPPSGVAAWGTSCPPTGTIGDGTITINNTSTLTMPAPAPTSWTVCAELEGGGVVCESNKL